MKPFINKEFTALTIKIARSKYALEYIPQLISFYEHREGQEDYAIARLYCETFISLIYSKNERYEEALAFDLKHLKELSFDDPKYANSITNAIHCANALDRNNEVVSYVLGFLAAEKKDYLSHIFILDWYITCYPISDNSTTKIVERAFLNTIHQLRLKIDSSNPLRKRVTDLVSEYNRATHAVRMFDKAYAQADAQTRKNILDEYLGNESISYFKDIVKNRFQ